jgi:hypothetical protein
VPIIFTRPSALVCIIPAAPVLLRHQRQGQRASTTLASSSVETTSLRPIESSRNHALGRA